MQDDLVQTLIYVLIGLIGVIASAYKNKQKKKQAGPMPPVRQVPRGMQADTHPDFGPELEPLMDIFDIPRKTQPFPSYETVEDGPSVEDEGMLVDTPESAVELAGMKMAEEAKAGEKMPAEETFEEGQSDIQKLIAKYDAIRKELDQEYEGDEISAGEIISVEAAEAAQAMLPARERVFEPRKAIIYSEILKRKEY